MIYRISLGLVGLLAMGWTALAAGEPSAMEGWSAKGAAQLDSDTGTFHGSGPSLRMTISDGSGGISRPIMPFPIAPFSVSGAVKVEGNFEFSQVAVQFFNASRKQVGWKPIAPLKSGKDWTTFQSEVTPVPEATVALLVVAAKGKGTIWLDEMAISTDGAPAAAPVVAEKPAVSEAAPLPVKVAADDSHLLYEGRFDLTNPKAPRCSWPASSVTLKFKGQTANVEMTGKANVRWQVYVDGQPTDVLINNGKPQVLALAKDLPAGEHTIQLLKRTEAMVGSASIAGFQLADGSELLAPDKPKRKIEVIGDSISAGFGDEAKDQYQKFTPETEHAGIAYGALAARDLGAEYMCIAWSGKKMWPNNTIPELYDEIIPTEPGKKWDFSKWKPDAVVINLATNDFGPGDPDEEGWVKAYGEFIERLRKNYPDAYVFCLVSPMLSDQYSKSKDARTAATRYVNRVVDERHKAGDPKVAFVDIPMQTGSLGFGAGWHPSAKQQEAGARVLAAAIKEKLGW